MESPQVSPWKTGFRYGIVLGMFAVILILALYFINPSLITSLWASLLLLIAGILVLVFAAKEKRMQLGGYISFREALRVCFAVAIVYGLIYSVFEYVLYNWIDSGLTAMIKEQALEATEKWMDKFGAPQEEIDKTLEEIEKEDFSMTLKSTAWNFATVCIFGFILSAIAALIVKKDKPAEAA